jgi:hypothetical protein
MSEWSNVMYEIAPHVRWIATYCSGLVGIKRLSPRPGKSVLWRFLFEHRVNPAHPGLQYHQLTTKELRDNIHSPGKQLNGGSCEGQEQIHRMCQIQDQSDQSWEGDQGLEQ